MKTMSYKVVRTTTNEVIYIGKNWLKAINTLMILEDCENISFYENDNIIWSYENNTWGDLLEYDILKHEGKYINS